jgi:hypothetical protein
VCSACLEHLERHKEESILTVRLEEYDETVYTTISSENRLVELNCKGHNVGIKGEMYISATKIILECMY